MISQLTYVLSFGVNCFEWDNHCEKSMVSFLSSKGQSLMLIMAASGINYINVITSKN